MGMDVQDNWAGNTRKVEDGCSETTAKFRKIELCLEETGLAGYSFRLISASWETSYGVLSCSDKGDVVISMGSDEFGDLGVGVGGGSLGKDF